MDLRHYLDIARRQKWIIIEAVVVVAVVAGIFSALKTPTYQSTARVLLRPNDPTEQLYSSFIYYDPDRYLGAQADIIASEAVATAAADGIPGGLSAGEVLGAISVQPSDTTDVIDITATSLDPVQARDIANAVALAYIENRKQDAVGDLQRVADQLEVQAQELQNQIAVYDTQIGDGGIDITGGATPAVPEAPAIEPPAAPAIDAPAAPDIPAPAAGEGLVAARYAAAVQYQEVFSRRQELLIDIGLKQGGAELLAVAGVPGQPVGAGTTRNAVLGGFVGLLLGLGVAFLREQLDDRVRGTDDLERATTHPVLAELPADPRTAGSLTYLATREEPAGAVAESVRGLRTTVRFLGFEQPVRRLVVTSAGPSEGKSHVAANLAAAYAQSGAITVLVSADLRRPRVEALFGVSTAAPGLSDLIANHAMGERALSLATSGNGNGNGHVEVSTARTLAEHLVGTEVPNLYLLPAGAAPPNPSELLGSQRARELFDALSVDADIVVIDTPPVLAVTDAAVVAATAADSVLLVAARSETRRTALGRTVDTLERAGVRILGVVLNKAGKAAGYGYHGYYGHRVDGSGGAGASRRRGRRKAPAGVPT